MLGSTDCIPSIVKRNKIVKPDEFAVQVGDTSTDIDEIQQRVENQEFEDRQNSKLNAINAKRARSRQQSLDLDQIVTPEENSRILKFQIQKLKKKSYLYKNLAYDSVQKKNQEEIEALQAKIDKIAAGEPLEEKLSLDEIRQKNLKEKEQQVQSILTSYSKKEKMRVSNSLTIKNEKLDELQSKYKWVRFKSEFRQAFEKNKRDIIKRIQRPIDDNADFQAKPIDLKKMFKGAKGITTYTGNKILGEHACQINYKTSIVNLENDMNKCIPQWLMQKYENEIKNEKKLLSLANSGINSLFQKNLQEQLSLKLKPPPVPKKKNDLHSKFYQNRIGLKNTMVFAQKIAKKEKNKSPFERENSKETIRQKHQPITKGNIPGYIMQNAMKMNKSKSYKHIDNLTKVSRQNPLTLETREFSKMYQKVRAGTPLIKGSLDINFNEINLLHLNKKLRY